MRIGVRELRQHASRYLALVQRGEVVEVTDRGRLVARLVPAESDEWEQLVASGGVTLADPGVNLLDEMPADYGIDASAALAELRRDER
jgi:prevent-host-death family protein